MDNVKVANVLNEVGELLEMKGKKYKSRAYQKASRSVESLSEDVVDIYERGELEDISGVGKSISEDIEELIEDGELSYYGDLKDDLPMDVDSLMRVPELGPKRIKKLHDSLGIESLDDLEDAAEDNDIREVDGFGEKIEESIPDGVELARRKNERFLLGYIIPVVEKIKEDLEEQGFVNRVEVAGSYRRRKETVGDLDFLITSSDHEQVMDYFVGLDDVDEVLAKGDTKSMVRLVNGINVDVRVVDDEEYGSALQYFTGSKDHNVKVRQIALDQGYSLSEYGLFDKESDERVGGETEEEIYEMLGLDWVPPELRTGHGEIEAAKNDGLPDLIDYGSCRGDFQTQTSWSDGSNSIEEMARKGIDLGWDFIVITDHSGNIGVANPLDEDRLREQSEEIRRVNDLLDDIEVLKGVEVDIVEDGSLAIDREMQEELDVVLATVHSHFKMSEEEMTDRVCNALENERVHVFGHPTGRRLHKREGYNIDMDKVFDVAVDNNVWLEIDGHPERMDMNGELAKRAKEAGCDLVISSDAHSVEGLDFVSLGESLARRGWCEESDIINTYSLDKIRELLNSK